MDEPIKNKSNRSRIIDTILHGCYALCTIFSFYVAYSFGLIPYTWLHAALAIIVILFLISILLCFKQRPFWAKLMQRILLVIISVVLATAGYFLQKSKTAFDRISQAGSQNAADGLNTDVAKTEKMFVVVNAASDKTALSQLQDGIIGFQNTSDLDRSEYMKEEIQKSIAYQSHEAMDYTTLLYDLSMQTIDAVAISESFYNMACANDTGLEENLRIIHTYERNIKQEIITKNITRDSFTIYLSGLDNVGSPDQQTRTDTNLILIVNPRAKHIDMVSLPRDGYMPNSALGYVNDKLTHTGMYGIDASIDTIEYFYGIDIDYYARVSFNSLIQIIDIMDGIDVDVEIDFCEQDENRSFAKDDLICLKAGEQTLNGKQALAYARHRKTLGYDNAGRERAQRRIIQAMIDKLFSANALSYINELLEEAPNYVITDMSTKEIAGFISHELEDLGPWTISSLESDTGVYDSQYVGSISPYEGPKDVYLFSQSEVQSLINAYDGASKPMKMPEYKFNLNDLYADCPQLNQDPSILWDFEASNPH